MDTNPILVAAYPKPDTDQKFVLVFRPSNWREAYSTIDKWLDSPEVDFDAIDHERFAMRVDVEMAKFVADDVEQQFTAEEIDEVISEIQSSPSDYVDPNLGDPWDGWSEFGDEADFDNPEQFGG